MKRFFQQLFKKTSMKKTSSSMVVTPEDTQQLLKAVRATETVEYSCDDVYQLMDQYVEMVKRGEDTASLIPLVEHHLMMCADCREEVEALLRMLDVDSH